MSRAELIDDNVLQAIQEFDQNLYEDESVNRMQEAVMLFDSVSNSRYFSETSIILFLNKIDLFKAKLKSGVLLKDHCPDYTGPNDYESGYVSSRMVIVRDPVGC